MQFFRLFTRSTLTKHELMDSQPLPLFQVLLLVFRDTPGMATSKLHFLPPSCTSVLSLLWIKPRSVHTLSLYSTTQAYIKPSNFVFSVKTNIFFLNLKLCCHYKKNGHTEAYLYTNKNYSQSHLTRRKGGK